MPVPSLDTESSQSSAGYADGLGRRVLAFDRETGGILERLILRPELLAYEQALTDRIAIVAGLEDERFARPRLLERQDDRLTVVSDYVAGRRLSDIIESAGENGIVAGLDAGLGLLLELLPALARLHDAGPSHGALAPGRLMITPAAQIVLLDCVYAEPLERLQLTRKRLWAEFRLAFPPTAGLARFDKAADLGHAVVVAATLSVGRELHEKDYPEGIPLLRQEILEIASIRGSKSFADAVDKLFASTLPIAGRRTTPSAEEAAIELRKLVRKELGINTCRTALLEFFQQVEAADAERVSADAAMHAQAVAAAAERARRESDRKQWQQPEPARTQSGRSDADRSERGRAEQNRAQAERLERERIDAERAEADRIEAERVERERAEQRRLEVERAERLEHERLEIERAEQARREAERVERERLEIERAERLERERLEAERLERERIEQARLEAERRERERLEAERLERERIEAERLERERIEQARLEAERLERERLEAERLERERIERARLEAERIERARQEAERLERERLEAERRERERMEQARLEAERLERERLEAERLERERIARERAEKARLEAERLERERIEQARLEAERLERERIERERAEKARVEAERRERERIAQERAEKARVEAERRERERLEAERLERERLDAERLERERAEAARLAAEQRERERQAERAAQAREQAEHAERERRDAARQAEQARREAERLAQERLEAEQREQQEADGEEEPDNSASKRIPVAPTRSGWLIPPNRSASFEPTAPQEPPPQPAARPYPIYVAPAEPAAWTAATPAVQKPADFRATVADVRPAPATPPAPVPLAPLIRLKGDDENRQQVRVRAESRREPVAPDVPAADPYEPFQMTAEPRQIPWKLIAAGVGVILVGGGAFAVWRGYAPVPAPVVETVRSVIPMRPSTELPPVAANVGRLVITTQPAGAKVTVDGKAAGETPLTIDGVKPGRHTVALIGPEGSTRRAIRVEAGQSLTLDVPLFSGFVAISVPFVVTVTEAGKVLGTSENQILLGPGRHILRLANKDLGYSETETVEITSGETTRLDRDPMGRANINAAPWAEVFIDGEKAGETPLANVPIRLGVREIVFKNPQFPERKQTVTITAGPAATVSVDFVK